MDKDTLHLWFAYPDDLLDPEALYSCNRLLSPDEVARCQSYKYDRSRREYLATHALARTALSYGRETKPGELRFRIGTHGKPSLDPQCGLQFNLSNSAGLVVCLVWEGGVLGVDVEPRTRAESIRDVAGRMFSPLELAQLNSLPKDRQHQRCLELWTLKESYIKARGMGFKLPLREFSFVFDESNNIRLQLEPSLHDDETRWRFCIVEHADHCIALMVETQITPHLHFWDARPACGSPRPINSVSGAWQP